MLPVLLLTTALNQTSYVSNQADFLPNSSYIDIVAISIVGNWSHVCHHIHAYAEDLCKTLMANPMESCSCTPLAVGSVVCVKGICICLSYITRRSLDPTTSLTMAIKHRIPFSNSTQWPHWAASVRIIESDRELPYWLIAASATCVLVGLATLVCIIRAYRRYMGYKKLPSAKGVDPVISRSTNVQ